MTPLRIWTNHGMSVAERQLVESVAEGHELVCRPGARSAPELAEADVAFGQPPRADAVASPRLRWVQLSSAGYGSYDTPETRAAFEARGAVLTKSSHVYATPCAQHVLAFMLSWARQLPLSFDAQRSDHAWHCSETRKRCFLLEDQRVVLAGFGSIGERLVELLAPLTRNVVGIRQRVRGSEPIETLAVDDARVAEVLGRADHVVNLLPGTASTERFFDEARLSSIREGAIFYNVGRGTTVDQEALATRLEGGQLAAALLDVSDPEPLPPEHRLWSMPNCVITPHSAGGHHNEGERLVRHFADNLGRFLRAEPVVDRAF